MSTWKMNSNSEQSQLEPLYSTTNDDTEDSDGWVIDCSDLNDSNSLSMIMTDDFMHKMPDHSEGASSDPFTEVSVKYESYISCTDCGRNFSSKQKHNTHIKECSASEGHLDFSDIINSLPLPNLTTEASPPQLTASALVKLAKGSPTLANDRASTSLKTEPEPDPDVLLQYKNDLPESITYTFDPSSFQYQSPAPGSVSPSYFTPCFEESSDLADELNLNSDYSAVPTLSVSPQPPVLVPESYTGFGSNRKGKGKLSEPLECATCKKVYHTKYGYTLHLRTHTGEKAYPCDICGKRFSQSGHLKDHRRIHTGEKPFGCTLCEKKFAQNQNLKHHMRMHTGIGPFHCTLCNTSFFTKREFKTHEKVHTGEQLSPEESKALAPYHCDICGAAFKRKGSLSQHVKFHFVSPKDRGQEAA